METFEGSGHGPMFDAADDSQRRSSGSSTPRHTEAGWPELYARTTLLLETD